MAIVTPELVNQIVSAPKKDWGAANITSVADLYYGKETFREKVDSQRQDIEEALMGIVPTDALEFVGPEEVVAAGISGACPVIPDVLEQPGLRETFLSYTIRNKAFLEIGKVLETESVIREKWFAEGEIPKGAKGTLELTIPSSVNPNVLAPIQKVPCFFASNLLKTLFGIGEGWVTLNGIELTEEQKNLINILWEDFYSTIKENTRTLDLIATNLAVKAIEMLINKGLSNEIITAIMAKAYNPDGPIKEYGLDEEVSRIWISIINNLEILKDQRINLHGIQNDLQNWYFSEKINLITP